MDEISGGIHFELNEDQQMLQNLARDFAANEITPKAEHYDTSGEWPRDIFDKAHEIGLAPETEVLAGWDYPGWSPEWWEVMGDKGVGVMYPTFSCAKLKLTSLGEHFKKAFVAEYEFDPPIYAYFLYDEVMIIADAMERTKSSDSKKLAQALTTTRFDGTTGVITFDREEGPIWNQWMGHQLFVLQLTEPNQKGKDAAVIYP